MKMNNIIKSLGKIPVKVPLNLQFHEEIDCGEYIRHTVSYAVEENETIKSYLLIPKNICGKVPAIVAAHQHAGQYHLGKCEPVGIDGDSMYFYGHELAITGYVVICPDHLGFEERKIAVTDGGLNERELFCKAICNGSTLQAKYVSDLSAATDVLCELDFVDKNRLDLAEI